MRRGLWAGVGALLLLVACSSGGGSAAKATTTSTTTSTTAATTSTTSPDDAVKQAYLDYWAMIDRLNAAPDPNDPELAQRTEEPLLSDVKGQLDTTAHTGHSYKTPAGRPHSHTVSQIEASGQAASLHDCYVDGTVEFDESGNTVDDAISTRQVESSLVLVGTVWKVSRLKFVDGAAGEVPCG
jgi:hypothetical protein